MTAVRSQVTAVQQASAQQARLPEQSMAQLVPPQVTRPSQVSPPVQPIIVVPEAVLVTRPPQASYPVHPTVQSCPAQVRSPIGQATSPSQRMVVVPATLATPRQAMAPQVTAHVAPPQDTPAGHPPLPP